MNNVGSPMFGNSKTPLDQHAAYTLYATMVQLLGRQMEEALL
jgi:hypothetical protein